MASFKAFGTGSEFLLASGAGTPASPGVLAVGLQAGEAVVGQVTAPSDLIAVVPVCDTSIMASGDLIADATAIAGAVRVTGGRAILQSLTILDSDAQGVAFSIYFMSTSTSFGTLNSAPNISDANLAAGLLGRVDVATADYTTLSGAKVASLKNIGLVIEVPATTMYFAIVNSTGTPTFTASGLKLFFGLLQD